MDRTRTHLLCKWIAGFAFGAVGLSALISAIQIMSRDDPHPLLLIAATALAICLLACIGMYLSRPPEDKSETGAAESVTLPDFVFEHVAGALDIPTSTTASYSMANVRLRYTGPGPIRVDKVTAAIRTITESGDPATGVASGDMSFVEPRHDETGMHETIGLWGSGAPGDWAYTWRNDEQTVFVAELGQSIARSGLRLVLDSVPKVLRPDESMPLPLLWVSLSARAVLTPELERDALIHTADPGRRDVMRINMNIETEMGSFQPAVDIPITKPVIEESGATQQSVPSSEADQP